ncbi:MAG: dihydroorotase [Lentisphaerae bacterium GWF2_44_16]|nr:MAG: dihydroorotase [Lentisphaerae bacterium GWF2_44_16]
MTEKSSYILTGARVVDPSRGIDEIMDIGIENGKIANPSEVKGSEKIDLSGLVLAPGFIDMHVHLRQPGNTASETIRTGTMAAAAGGFTAVVAMPNTNPPADNAGSIEYIRRQSVLEAVVKVHPCGSMTKGQQGQEMSGIGTLKRAGVVAISDDGKCIQNHEIMLHVVEYSKSFNIPILDHCEDDILASHGVMHEGYWSTLLGMKGISPASEELMIARDIILARMVEWKIHIQHLSSRNSVELIRNARKEGIMVTAEVTPHHIALTDENIKHFDTNYKMNPPLRSEEDRKALIKGLKDGTITVIASDHAPHTETEKLVEFDYAPFGIIGLETSVPVCFTELYHSGDLSLSELISKYTIGPARVLGLDSGTLEEGKDADITILDIDIEHNIDASNFYSKSRNTPFDGLKVKGKAVATIVNGKFVFNTLMG